MANWLDNFNDGEEPPVNYNSIPTGIIKPPKIVYTTSGSRYMPEEQTIYLNPEEDYYDPSIYQHEMFHHWQNLNDKLRKPDEYEGPLAKPSIVANEEAQMDYYNRRNVETKEEFDKLYKQFPVFRLTTPYLIYDKKVNPELYKNPKYAEGEAEEYQDYIKSGGTPAFMAKGGLIKRADGSYSRRGLWDNIRANRGSGRKPTPEMLEQEKKIKKHADGNFVEGENPPATFGNPYADYMRDWTNSPMGQQMLQKSISLDNPSGRLFKNENSYNNASIAERSLRNVQGEAVNPNYSKASFIKPYWEQMRDARTNALNNVDFQILPNQSFNSYLNTSGNYNLGANEVSSTAGESKFSLTRKDFNNFIDNPTVDKFREVTRPENVDNINYLPYVANPYRALNEYTPSSKFRSMIRLRNNVADDNLADTSIHELSHTSDWNGVLMPQSDVNLIESYSKNAPDTEWGNYVKTPTETRARLNALRFQMKNQGIYNPFVEKATMKAFDSYKPLTDDSYDPLLQLRSIYTDEQILDMMNTISRKEPSKNSIVDNTQYAKDGGWIHMYADGDVVGEDPKPVTPTSTPISYNINDFYITPDEIELYKQRAEECHSKGQCLEQAFRFYDKYVAPNLGTPNSWDIKKNAGISSGATNPNFNQYGESADSWDIHGLLQEKGATKILAADLNNPMSIEQNLSKMTPSQQEDYFISLNIPLGSVIGMGSSGTNKSSTSYNSKLGLVDSNHSASVIGYNERGVPMIYDYGEIVPITSRTFDSNGFPITNITAPKETAQYTYEYLKANNKLQNDYTPLNLKTNTTEYDEDEYIPFIDALKNNKAQYANAFGLTNTEYDEFAKKAAALALTETKGGDDNTWRGIIPTYITDKLGLGDTTGITQINSDMIFNSKELSKKLEAVGITKDNYDPWNSNHIAAATIALLKSNVRPAERAYNINTQKLGYDPGLSDAAITYYQWNQPSLLIKGEAKGESEKVKKFQNNYNLIDIGDYLQLNPEGVPVTTLSGVEVVGKKADGGWIDMYNEGSWVTNSSIPTPTTPSFYDAYPDRTLTNYQMGTDKAPMYKNRGPTGGGVQPFITSDPNLYKQRQQAYNDSLSLYNQGLVNKKQYLNFINNLNLDTSRLVSGPPLKSKTSNKIQPITHTNLESWGSMATLNGPLYTIYKGKDGKDIQIDKEDVISKINKGYSTYKKPVQSVILEKENIPPITSNVDRVINVAFPTHNEQPIAPTPYVPDPVRRVMNPAFDYNTDFLPNRTKEAVVDQAGNPRYKYYNGDKVITEQEYNKLIEKKANGGLVMYGGGGGVKPFITSDINEYNRRKQAYADSAYAHNVGLANWKNAQLKLKQNVDKFNAQLPSAFGHIIGPSVQLDKPYFANSYYSPVPIKGIWPTKAAHQYTVPHQYLSELQYLNLYHNPSFYEPLTGDALKSYNQNHTGIFYFPYDEADKYHASVNLYDAPKQQVIFDKNAPKNKITKTIKSLPTPVKNNTEIKKEDIEPVTRKFNFSIDEDMQPIREAAPQGSSQPMLRMVPNPKFNLGAGKRTKEAVVDELGNPRNLYYYGDKAISKKEYSKLWDEQNNKFAQGGPVMYNAGSTVWTKQNVSTVVGSNTPSSVTQNYRNTGSLNPNRYLIGGKDIISTGMDYKTPAAGTYDYSKDIQPYYTMRLHAPDTTMMARHGGHIKKHINSPRIYGSPVNPDGMYKDGSIVMYGPGGGIQDIINQTLNQSRPQASTTSTNTPIITKAINHEYRKSEDVDKLSDEDFKNKYNEGKHRYKYRVNPQYKAEVDADIQQKVASGAPMIKEKVEVNPNNMWMVPGSGYTDEMANSVVNENLNTIGIALPIPGVEAVGKVPSLLEAAEGGLKALRYEGRVLTDNLGKGLVKVARTKGMDKIPILQEHFLGTGLGLQDIAFGSRPFSEVFPLTKKQIANISAKQDAAFNESTEFMKDWFLPDWRTIKGANKPFDKTVRTLSKDIAEATGSTGTPYHWHTDMIQNAKPILTRNNKFFQIRKKLLEAGVNPDLATEYAAGIRFLNRGRTGGIAFQDLPGNPITYRNSGFYFHPPEAIASTGAHELGHTSQYAFPAFDNIVKPNGFYKYDVPNKETPIGKEFSDIMVQPNDEYEVLRNKLHDEGVLDKYISIQDAPKNLQKELKKAYNKSYSWEGSPAEVHSELFSARFNLYKALKNVGFSHDAAMSRLKIPFDDTTQDLIDYGNLNRFFKPETTFEQKAKALGRFYKDGGAVKNNNSNTWLDSYN